MNYTRHTVAEELRLDFFPSVLPKQLLVLFESSLYGTARKYFPDYTGGYWEFYDLVNPATANDESQAAWYLAPQLDMPMKFENPNNYSSGQMSADGMGLALTMFLCSNLADPNDPAERLARNYHRLYEYLVEADPPHPDLGAILAFLD